MTTIDLPSITPGMRATPRVLHSAVVPEADPQPAPAGPAPGPAPAAQRRSFVQRLASLLGTLLMVLAIVAVLFFAVGPRFFGYQTATMLTGSMAPEIVPGDVVVTTLQPVSGIAVGDVISYHIPVEDHRVETHRVVEVIRGADGTTAVRTKGDANGSVDPWIATLEGDSVYEAAAVIPQVGNAIRALRTPVVSHVLVYGIPAVLVGALLLMIWSRPDQDEAGDDTEDDTDRAMMTGDPEGRGHRGPSPERIEGPALDRAVLEGLGEELASRAGALQFAEAFVDLLPQRVRAVEDAFASRDADAAVVALLSLNVSASMVGARRLEEGSSAALGLIDDPREYPAVVARLRILSGEFQAALGGIMR
ncbi:signal peptidase I [Arthrobacter sp. B0490]|uniref:signal peptidase I n=1 Tax=Arthrobacter sp. B0490 TaxID=2058891 RepID=UPI0021583D6F|nr:signal peptidase I [Arthrobacter sp. B0490]